MSSYFQRLTEVSSTRGKLCVGIDPQPSMLQAWGLDDSVESVERLSRQMIEALGDLVAVFKPQSGFFEPYGSAGIAVLERVIADIRDTGALCLLDVKRGDIGSTMDGYARAYLTPGAPLEVDAITVSPFLGFGSLTPAIELAHANDKGIYVLARTSNPEGSEIQLARPADYPSISQSIIDQAYQLNQDSGKYAIGIVVGATHLDLGCQVDNFNSSILAPGIGAQGGSIQQLDEVFGAAFPNVLPSVSRQVIRQGPHRDKLRKATRLLLK